MNLPKSKKTKSQSGQALIIILLAMSVALTLVLTSVSRSVTDIRITSQEEESLRAFSAAEAGIEEALFELTRTGRFSNPGCSKIGDNEYCVKSQTGRGGNYYEYPKKLSEGETATFWLVGYDQNGELDCGENNAKCVRSNQTHICFGDPSMPPAAIEVQFYYDDTGNPAGPYGTLPDSIRTNNYSTVKVDTKAYDSHVPRLSSNNFSGVSSCGIPGFNDYDSGISIINNQIGNCRMNATCVIMLKVKALYASDVPVIIAHSGGNNPNLPPQGIKISSTGSAGEAQRRLDVEYNYDSAPEIFDNTIFSGGDIVQ